MVLVGDDVVEQGGGRYLSARGHVRLISGQDRGTADMVRLDRLARQFTLEGHARVTTPHLRASADGILLFLSPADEVVRTILRGHAVVYSRDSILTAGQVDADRASGRAVATGHVVGRWDERLVATSDRATFDLRTGDAVLEGAPRVTGKMGWLQGRVIRFDRRRGLVHVAGPVTAEVDGAAIRGRTAEVNLRAESATFQGDVTVVRRQGTLWADRATVYYGRDRIVAEGGIRLRLVGDARLPGDQ